MAQISIEEFEGKIDSLYRLVIVAARRAGQLNRPETRSLLTPIKSKKPTINALEEIRDGKVTYRTGAGDEEDFIE